MRRVRQPTGARQVPEAAECPQGQEGPAERCRRPSRVYLILLFSEESDAPAGGRVRGFAAARRRPGHASGAARREVGGTREEGRRGGAGGLGVLVFAVSWENTCWGWEAESIISACASCAFWGPGWGSWNRLAGEHDVSRFVGCSRALATVASARQGYRSDCAAFFEGILGVAMSTSTKVNFARVGREWEHVPDRTIAIVHCRAM